MILQLRGCGKVVRCRVKTKPDGHSDHRASLFFWFAEREVIGESTVHALESRINLIDSRYLAVVFK